MMKIGLALLITLLVAALLGSLLMKKGKETKVKVNERLKFGSDEDNKKQSPQAQAEAMRRRQASRKPEEIPFRERVLLPIWQSLTGRVMQFAPSALADIESLPAPALIESAPLLKIESSLAVA